MLAADRHGNTLFEFEHWQGEEAIARGEMPHRLITYNGAYYDLPVCAMVRANRDPRTVAEFSAKLIGSHKHPRQWLKAYGVRPWRPQQHIDVMQMRNYAPVGLKQRAARLHHPKFELIPADPTKPLARDEAEAVKSYCANDCAATWVCLDDAGEFIDTLAALPVDWPLETSPTVSAEQIWRTKAKPESQWTPDGDLPPVQTLRTDFSDTDAELRLLQHRLDAMQFEMDTELAALHGLPLRLCSGGLHTCERGLVVDDVYLADASSYYARLIISADREHRAIRDFPGEVQTLLNMRLEREQGRDIEDSAGRTTAKLLLASAAGKLNSPYSCLYDRGGYLTMTRSGQSLMLDMAARLMAVGAKVYSINTDGVVCDMGPAADSALDDWQGATGIPLTRKAVAKYRARDVSSYVAEDYNGEIVKCPGAFFGRSRNRNPLGPIIADAASRAVLDCDTWQGAYNCITDMVCASDEPGDFAILRQAKTTIHADNKPLGKLVRYAVAHRVPRSVALSSAGRKIPHADSVALMPDYETFDMDRVDRSYYIAEALSMWESVHAKGPLL